MEASPGHIRAPYSHAGDRDGSSRVQRPFPGPGDGGGRSGGAGAAAGRPRAARGIGGDLEDADGGGAGDDPVEGQGAQPALAGISGERGRRYQEACAALRAGAVQAYPEMRQHFDASLADHHARIQKARQLALDESFLGMPALRSMSGLLASLAGDAGAAAAHLSTLKASVKGRLQITSRQVRFVGMGFVSFLDVPTFILDGNSAEPFTPPAATCFAVPSSPVAIVDGTVFFDWDLLEWVSTFFFTCGVSIAGEISSFIPRKGVRVLLELRLSSVFIVWAMNRQPVMLRRLSSSSYRPQGLSTASC